MSRKQVTQSSKTAESGPRIKKRPVEEEIEEIKADNAMVDEKEKPKPKAGLASIFLKGSDQKKLKSDDPVPQSFYMCDVVELSEKLIGMYLIRVLDDGTELKAMIVETEAYKAPLDKACHAYNNKKTERTKWFWQDGGHLYMYSIYGNNNCMNIVSATKDEPEAVLIRALEPITGIATMRTLRNAKPTMKDKELTNGPGKLSQAINIDKDFNGHDLTQKGKFYLVQGRDPKTFTVETSKRINIDYAEEWVHKLWRFTYKGSPYISKK